MNTDWRKRIKHIIYYINRRSRRFKIILFIGLIIIITNWFPNISWIIVFLAIFIWHPRIPIMLPKDYKAVRHLRKAIEFIYQQDYSKALKELVLANDAYPNMVLQDLIKDFSQFYDISEYSELAIIEKEIKRTKDKKDLNILYELEKTLNYIVNHKQKLEEISEKITSLEKELEQAPQSYKKELNNIISRYQSIKRLEKSKIDFYTQTKKELWNLHREYLFRNKIEQERKLLSELESQYLTDSVRESLEADQQTSFIDYQNAYLEALAQYADEIEEISSNELFEEIKREFDLKKQQIKNNQ